MLNLFVRFELCIRCTCKEYSTLSLGLWKIRRKLSQKYIQQLLDVCLFALLNLFMVLSVAKVLSDIFKNGDLGKITKILG